MAMLTVFTPTYNRAELLKRCYESMCRQTRQDFIWMIIDDGSTDNTRDFAEGWKLEKHGFILQYYYKENGGLHTAYNEAISHINTELCVCIDSDDFMPDNAVEIICEFWAREGSDSVAGIVGLDYTLQGKVIGDPLPDQREVNLIDLLAGKYKLINGDRTNIVRTELYKKYAPMKVFPGEKNFNPHYLHIQISKEYNFLVLNENLRYVDYQADGMTASILKQYLNSPNSFLETRKLYLGLQNTPVVFQIRNAIHYDSSIVLAGRSLKEVINSPKPLLTMIMFPTGLLLACFIKKKAAN